MSLDRDAARALFANAEPTPAMAGGPASSVIPPLGTAAGPDVYARMTSRSARKGPDWRIIAPVGVAALCAGVVLMVASQRNDAEPGQTVAAVDVTPPAPVAPAPVETAAATPPPAAIVEPPATEPATVRVRARSEPARRPAAPRTVASAPSATDAGSNVSSYERAIPPPVLGAPAEVIVTPAAPPPVETPPPQM